jgi:hypothetical protein
MKADLIKKLRLMNIGLSHEAADRIEKLETENKELHDLEYKWGVRVCYHNHPTASWQMKGKTPEECPFCANAELQSRIKAGLKLAIDMLRMNEEQGDQIDAVRKLPVMHDGKNDYLLRDAVLKVLEQPNV